MFYYKNNTNCFCYLNKKQARDRGPTAVQNLGPTQILIQAWSTSKPWYCAPFIITGNLKHGKQYKQKICKTGIWTGLYVRKIPEISGGKFLEISCINKSTSTNKTKTDRYRLLENG